MRIIKDFEKGQAQTVIDEMEAVGAKLVEVQYHLDGNHLVFDMPDWDMGRLVREVVSAKTRISSLEASKSG